MRVPLFVPVWALTALNGPHSPQRPSIHYTIAVAPPRPAYVPTMPAAYGVSKSALPALAGPNFECQQVFADNVLKAGDYISLGICVSSPTSYYRFCVMRIVLCAG